MKKTISGILAAVAAFGTVTAFAQTPTIKFNNETMTFDAEPYITELGNTMVPFRAIFEKAGADVMWDEEKQTVVAVKDDADKTISVVLQIGNKAAFVNDQQIDLESAPEIQSDRTFVPLRFVMESLGAKVDWDQDTYTVSITAAE